MFPGYWAYFMKTSTSMNITVLINIWVQSAFWWLQHTVVVALANNFSWFEKIFAKSLELNWHQPCSRRTIPIVLQTKLDSKWTECSGIFNHWNEITSVSCLLSGVSFSFDEIRSKYPELSLPPINSDVLTLKSIAFWIFIPLKLRIFETKLSLHYILCINWALRRVVECENYVTNCLFSMNKYFKSDIMSKRSFHLYI